MVEQLFGSKTRVKLLKLFYSNPNRSFYVREITRKIDEQINSVRRELANLLNIGIITSDNMNNRLYYEVNQKFELYEPLSVIFGTGTIKTMKKPSTKITVGELDSDLRILGNVELALYTGQFTHDELSGVDFLVVGDINPTQLNKFVAELEAKESKEIRYTSMSIDEYRYRLQVKDRFVANINQAKKQILIDKHGLLGQPAS